MFGCLIHSRAPLIHSEFTLIMLSTSHKKHYNQPDATNRTGEEEQDTLVAHVWDVAGRLQDQIGRLLDARRFPSLEACFRAGHWPI